MTLNLTGQNFPITPAIKTHTEEKLEKVLSRYTHVTNPHVILKKDSHNFVAEATLHFHTHEIVATATATDMYVAIDQLAEKIATQMQKQKEKIIDSHHQS